MVSDILVKLPVTFKLVTIGKFISRAHRYSIGMFGTIVSTKRNNLFRKNKTNKDAFLYVERINLSTGNYVTDDTKITYIKWSEKLPTSNHALNFVSKEDSLYFIKKILIPYLFKDVPLIKITVQEIKEYELYEIDEDINISIIKSNDKKKDDLLKKMINLDREGNEEESKRVNDDLLLLHGITLK